MTVIILAVILIVIFIAFSCGLAHYGVHIKRQSFEEALNWQKEHYDISFYDPLEKNDYEISSYDGYILPVQFIKNQSPTDKYIIITHGHTDNHFGMLKYAKMYLELGFNVILYDLRAHGNNKETVCTFSICESKDLYELIKDTRQRYPDIRILGLHGESLGGATAIAVLKYKPEVDFAVDDCGFAEIISVMQGGLKNMHIPQFMVYPASLCARIMYGYSFKDMRPIDALKDNKVPVLFIHGADDTYILPSHGERMSNATLPYHEFHTIPGAKHAESILTDPESYRGYVTAFLDKVCPGEQR